MQGRPPLPRSALSRSLLAAGLGLWLAASAVAAERADAPHADRWTALENDGYGRFTARVILDANAPMAFIVDTGAQASSLSRQAAAQLHLRPRGGSRMIGANGSQASRIVTVTDFRSDLFARQFESMLLIPNGMITNADGILGMKAFIGGRIEFDFAKRQFSFGPSRPTPAGFVAQAGDVVRNNFLIVDVMVDGVKARAMIDTGGTSVVGNAKLRAALGLADGDPRLRPSGIINGVTDQGTPTQRTTLGALRIGDTTFAKPSIVFADFPVFGVLGLDSGPSLIIGVDLLSRLQGLAIDYPRAELQLKP